MYKRQARFRERQNTPEKQWKITEEDWRNREKWDAYEEAVDEMLARTSTERAPWHILELSLIHIWNLLPRVFNPPELVALDLLPAEDKAL